MAKKKSSWKLWVNIATIAALVVLVFAIRRQIVQAFNDLGHVKIWALLLMVPIQALNYHVYAKLYMGILDLLGHKVTYKEMFKVQSELTFVNHVFPSGGVSGVSYWGLRLRDYGVSGGKSTLVQLMKFGLIFISFQVLLLIGLLCLAVVGRTSNLTIMVVASLTTLLIMGTLGASFIIGSSTRINTFFGWATKALNRMLHIVRPKSPETIDTERAKRLFTDLHENYMILKNRWWELKMPLVYALLANITEVLTVYVVYIAFGETVNIGGIIIAYGVANFAGAISVLPGGVGIYEALMTAVLSTVGVSPAVSIPVTVMYRIINTLIQVPPGYYLYHKVLRRPSEV